MNMFERLDRQPIKYHMTIGILFALAIGFLDYWEWVLNFARKYFISCRFHILPGSSVKKPALRSRPCLLLTILCTNMFSGENNYDVPFELWNRAIYFAFIIIVTLLLSKLRITLQQRANLITQLAECFKRD